MGFENMGKGSGKEAMAVSMIVVLAIVAIVMVTRTFSATGASPGDTELQRRLQALERREGFLDRMEARIMKHGRNIKLAEDLSLHRVELEDKREAIETKREHLETAREGLERVRKSTQTEADEEFQHRLKWRKPGNSMTR